MNPGSEMYLDSIRMLLPWNRYENQFPPGGCSCPMGFSTPGCELCHFSKMDSSGVLRDSCKVRKKCTKSQASSGLMLSAKEGIGVPSRPVIKMRYRSLLDTPTLNRSPVVKS